MPTIYDCFTHIDDLRQSEPSYFDPSSSHQGSNVPDSGPSTLAKTPVSVLQEGSLRIYERPPEYVLISETLNGNVPSFTMKCRLSGAVVEGEGKTKKLAKHRAATAMLYILIDKERRYASQLGINCETPEEARAFITRLSEEVFEQKNSSPPPAEVDENEPVFDSAVNYVGKVQEMCVRCKLETATYESKEEGPPNDRTFITICKVAQEVTEGKAKQKKASKSISAFKMMNILEKGVFEMNKDFDVGVTVGENDDDCEQKMAGSKGEITDPMKAVETLLADETKFSNVKTEYKIMEKLCSFGLTQCMLKVIYSKGGVEESPLIFPGAGTTEEDARISAAKMALVNLSTL